MRLFMPVALLVALVSLASGAPAQFDSASVCQNIFSEAGIEMDHYAFVAAHGTHSIFLEDLRHYYEADAPEDNGIPIVNTNINAPDQIWPNAPLVGFREDLNE